MAENVEVKREAYRLFKKAMQKGELTRPVRCERCGGTNQNGTAIAGHHEDYAKPLDVEWLCVVCHGATHRVADGRSFTLYFRDRGRVFDIAKEIVKIKGDSISRVIGGFLVEYVVKHRPIVKEFRRVLERHAGRDGNGR